MSSCPTRYQLERWLDLPAGESEHRTLAQHIDGCATCQRLLDELTGSVAGQRTATLATQDLPPESRLRQALRYPDEAKADRAPTTVAPASGPLGTPPRLENEIRDLLHWRLRVVAVVAAVVMPTLLLLEVTRLSDQASMAASTVPGLVLGVGGSLAALGTCVVLWKYRRLPLRRLRVLELLLFAVVVLWSANYRYVALTRGTTGPFEGPQHQAAYIELALLLSNYQWYCHILIYGLFIPNTARRCLAVVCGVAAVPLAITVAAAVTSEAVRERLPFMLTVTAAGMLIAGSLAVYGSFKISTLGQEAFDARRLGPYQLRRKLGAGGMGEVHLAEHRLLKRPCAIKFIRPELAGDPRLLRRFEREAHSAARLTHPNTVEVFDFGRTEGGAFYYVMEYLSGLSLDELAERHGPLPPERVVHFLRQVCGALSEAHGLGLIHRDIKPSNVFVCRQGGLHDVAKLLDFGLVHAPTEEGDASRLTAVGLVMGTPAFLSPEQARGSAALDARSDLYSLGALAYFLLTGKPPFPRATVAETIVAHLHDPVPPLTDVAAEAPPELQAAILRCLAKNPDDRFADAASFDTALAECSCAGTWTEARAAEWWRTRVPDGA
jgi:serine/threonine-protein kinase